jgi:hypothetical protein
MLDAHSIAYELKWLYVDIYPPKNVSDVHVVDDWIGEYDGRYGVLYVASCNYGFRPKAPYSQLVLPNGVIKGRDMLLHPKKFSVIMPHSRLKVNQ